RTDLAVVVQVKLQRGQRQRDDRAEQQHRCEQAKADIAAKRDDPLQQTGSGKRRRRRLELIQVAAEVSRRNDALTAIALSIAGRVQCWVQHQEAGEASTV